VKNVDPQNKKRKNSLFTSLLSPWLLIQFLRVSHTLNSKAAMHPNHHSSRSVACPTIRTRSSIQLYQLQKVKSPAQLILLIDMPNCPYPVYCSRLLFAPLATSTDDKNKHLIEGAVTVIARLSPNSHRLLASYFLADYKSLE